VPVEYVLAVVAVAVIAAATGWFAGRRGAAPVTAHVEPSMPSPAPAPSHSDDRPLELGDQLEAADQLRVGLVKVDGSGRVVSANASADDILGWRLHGLLGKTTLEAFLDHRVEDMAETARREGHAAGEYVLSGEPPRTLAVNVWRASDGGLWLAIEDVSELNRLRRIRTEFVDNLSHELRTPLSTVRLLTESLSIEAERTELPDRVKDTIAKIDVETGHLVQMVNELLDLAKIEQGDEQLRREPVDVYRLAREGIERLGVYAERQEVTLKVEIDDSGGDAIVRGDEDRLAQLLVNLVHNAIKFSPAGGEVVVHVRRDVENVVVEIEDHGPGIPAADRNRIFERFYKVDRARSRGRGGTGLGLAIARHIVERHGGHIWVQSEEGVGSRFFFSLPTVDRAR
jgi:two-component system, OmpR family, phosphate regulon sensor histidine kinase PhoR